MWKNFHLRLKNKFIFALIICTFFWTFIFCHSYLFVKATPFYDLEPKHLTLRSKFYTSYPSSTEERKANIALASKALDKVIVASGEEFSFNKTVGQRTEKRGYKNAKIIVNGEFVDGIGGGVCQVSTTLYNAVLLAGLKITEYHPHSLSVGYVAPSFDAMVNSGSADLKFINNTKNPVVIHTITNDQSLQVEIYGQPLTQKLVRKSVIVSEIPAPETEIVFDDLGEFPDLYEGESRVVKYGKAGLKSEGYIVTLMGDKIVSTQKIRSDKYSAIRGKVVMGKAIRKEISAEQPPFLPDLTQILS